MIDEQVADLKLLKEETHKFESRYMDNLIGNFSHFVCLINLILHCIIAFPV